MIRRFIVKKTESSTHKNSKKCNWKFIGDIILKDTCKSPDYTSVTIKPDKHVVVKRKYVFDSVEEAIKDIKHDVFIKYMEEFDTSDGSDITTYFPPQSE
jgi:hypothetical protein